MSASFTADEIALMNTAKDKGSFATNKEAMLAGFRLIVHGSEPDVPAILERLAREIRAKDVKKKPKHG